MSFPKYEKYKDSGIESIGLIPIEWSCAPFKYSTQLYTGNSLNDEEKALYAIVDEDSYPYISSKDIEASSGSINYKNGLSIPKKNKKFKIAPEGSFLLCIEGGSAGKKIGFLEEDVSFVNKLCCFKSEDDSNRFKYYFARSQNFKSLFSLSITGLIGGVSTNELKNFFIPIPSKSEILEIVKFLDHETAKIDELVKEQERLIELLKEKRQAVISHAVTRGLDPNVKLKPSGIEWLGDIPANWKVVPIKEVNTLFGRIGYRGYTTSDLVDEGEGAITLSPSNMNNGIISTENSTYISWEKYYESPEIMLAPSDVVMVKTGSTIGKVSYVSNVDHPTTINPQLVIFKKIKCNPRFLFFVLNTPLIQSLIEINNTGSTIPTMSQESVGNFRFALPSESEQEEIVNRLDSELNKLDILTTEAKQAINILQERRTALISAAVTGKIDVRQLNKN